MSIFDQRILKPSSDIFYFQLIPTHLFYHNTHEYLGQEQKQLPQNIVFKLYKGQILCDEVKKSVPVTIINENAIISRVYLNFNVSIKEQDKIIEFTVKICGVGKKQKHIYLSEQKKEANDEETYRSSRKQEKYCYEIGSCKIMANRYIQELQQKNANEFHQIYEINENCSLKFELYVAKSRFALQKFITKTRQQRKKDQKAIIELPKYNELQQLYIDNLREDRISQISQNQLIGRQHRFISADKRILKNKKLIVRNRSTTKNSRGDEEQVQVRNSKSADKSYLCKKIQNEESKNKIKESLTKRQKDSEKQIVSNSESHSNQNNNFLKACQKGDEVSKLKVDASLRTTEKTYNNQEEPKSPKTYKTLKSNKSQKSTSKQKAKNTLIIQCDKAKRKKQQDDVQKEPTNISINWGNLVSNKIFIVGFIVISFILLLNVMTPSRKV